MKIDKTVSSLAKSDVIRASLVLACILNLLFFPVLWGNKSLLISGRDVASVLPMGSYENYMVRDAPRFFRSLDPWAPAWLIEPTIKINHRELTEDKTIPLWNPYSAFGVPWAANMQSQPFYPPSFLLSLFASQRAYNIFLVFRLFLAGLFAFLYLRMLINKRAALFGAISMMLTGYFMIYINIDHIGVEVLIPLMFYSVELLLSKATFKSAIIVSVAILLAMLGGMPESTFLLLTMGNLYFVFRLLGDKSFEHRKLVRVRLFIIGDIAGVLLSSPLLFPFLEFMKRSFNLHQVINTGYYVGMVFDPHPGWFITYLLPMVFGPIYSYIIKVPQGVSPLRGYWGVVQVFFAIVASIVLFRPRLRWRQPLYSIALFFFCAALFFLLKRWGFVGVNWLGQLPVANMVYFVKYEEPLLGFSISVLAALGFALFISEDFDLYSTLIAAVLCLSVIITEAVLWMPQIISGSKTYEIFYLNIGAGILIVLVILVIIMINQYKPHLRYRLSYLALLLLTIEMSVNFVLPSFYVFNKLPDKNLNPYKGAPYISYLQHRNNDYMRVFGRDSILYPNWSGVFGIFDVRYIEAMTYKDYRDFMRYFLLDKSEEINPGDGDLSDRFTGTRQTYDFDTLKAQRFLQLSSVKYLLTDTPYLQNGVVNTIFDQNPGINNFYLRPWTMDIDNQTLPVFFQAAPSKEVSLKKSVNNTNYLFEFSVGISPQAYDAQAIANKIATKGVKFVISVRVGNASPDPVFSKTLDPLNESQDRHWIPEKIDLSRYEGKQVEIIFSTLPLKNDNYNWAAWGDPRFVDKAGLREEYSTQSVGFKKVYDKEIKIYEVSNVLPRASIFHSATIFSQNNIDVLNWLAEPGINITQQVAVASGHLSDIEKSELDALVSASPSTPEEARISSYKPQEVVIRAYTKAAGILMLNDTEYPGWNVYVDGKKSTILRADYLFRGVYLDPGAHIVTFKYQPVSFALGLAVFFITGLFLILGMLGVAWRRKTVQPAAQDSSGEPTSLKSGIKRFLGRGR